MVPLALTHGHIETLDVCSLKDLLLARCLSYILHVPGSRNSLFAPVQEPIPASPLCLTCLPHRKFITRRMAKRLDLLIAHLFL